jgi:hypothetical protein
LQTYEDGADNKDCDFNVLELKLSLDKNIKGISEAFSSLIADDRVKSHSCCGKLWQCKW